jgi:predicted phage baseplate assembly protein
VEESGRGFQLWAAIEDLALADRDAAVYTLDSEAGVVRFGDGVRGRIPEVGARLRVAQMRAGGGQAGNLPAGVLSEISARDLAGSQITNLKLFQPLPTAGGEDAESIASAEQRIPALFRHRERAVTSDDYERLAAETPGVRLGRVEVLPRFRPQQRLENATGVVAVMVLPAKPTQAAPNPRADRPLLEAVHAHLDARRPLATELYVIGCEYAPLGVSVGVTIADGAAYETVLNDVRLALRSLLWPLVGGGPSGEGWPLGGAVRERELEVTVARVAGVRAVQGVNLFTRKGDDWALLPRPALNPFVPQELRLEKWQLPELLSLVVVADGNAPTDLSGAPNPFVSATAVAVPVVPEVCY